MWAQGAFAQAAPSTSQVRPPDIPAAPSVSHILLPQVPAGAQVPEQAKKLSFVLVDFNIDGEFPELAAPRRALAAPLLGKRITVAELFDFANKLQQLYVRADYPLVRVVIVPQKLGTKARVKLRVIDGYVERIDAKAIAPQVRGRVTAVLAPLYDQHHLTQAILERKLLIAGEAAGLDLNATFAAGKDVGGTVLVLTGRFRPLSASLYTDNSMPSVFGTIQVVASGAINSPLGLGDQLSFSVAGLPDGTFFDQYPTRRFVSGTYVVPIGVDGWSLELYGTGGWTTPRVDPSARTQGLFQQAHARVSYELLKRRDYELILHGQVEATDEQNYELVTNPVFPLNIDRLRPMRLGFDGIWRKRDTGTTISGGGNYSHGFDVLGARSAADATPFIPLSRQGANDVFDKIDGHLQIDQALPQDFFASFSAAGQYSFGKPLLVAEQFDIAGPHAISGIAAGDIIGDTGYVVRGEFGHNFPVPLGGIGSVLVSPYVFVADADRHLYQPTILEVADISAVNFGGGLRYNFAPAKVDQPSSYGFIELSRLDSSFTGYDSFRLFAGMLLRY
jgi:hemolysin activation/secretion protein